MDTNGTMSESSFSAAWHRVRDIPSQVESGLKARPLAAAVAIAGVAFVGGMVLGSRVARAFLVAAAPAIAHRLLVGPLGEDLAAYYRRVFRSASDASPTVS